MGERSEPEASEANPRGAARRGRRAWAVLLGAGGRPRSGKAAPEADPLTFVDFCYRGTTDVVAFAFHIPIASSALSSTSPALISAFTMANNIFALANHIMARRSSLSALVQAYVPSRAIGTCQQFMPIMTPHCIRRPRIVLDSKSARDSKEGQKPRLAGDPPS